MESDADDDVPSREELKDRKTSFKRKKRKHDSFESCYTKGFEDANSKGSFTWPRMYSTYTDTGYPRYRAWCRELYNINDGWVLSFGRPKEPTTKEDDDGNEELLDRKREQLDENLSPMSDCLGQTIPRKASTSQCSIICVQGYEVKENVAPILEAIFKKHGDIAAKCVFTIASVRVSLLEVVCEVVRRIQTNDVIEKMEEIESHVSQAEAAKIDVSWLRVHLEAIYKRKDVMKKWSLLMETKVNTVLVQRAAQMDLRERCAELATAQERFEEAERCVRVLHLVETKLNNNILESMAEKDSWGRQPIL